MGISAPKTLGKVFIPTIIPAEFLSRDQHLVRYHLHILSDTDFHNVHS